MLSAIKSCINGEFLACVWSSLLIREGYKSLHEKVGLLQGDISTRNLIISDGEGGYSWPGFLIDLDLAIRRRVEDLLALEATQAPELSWPLVCF
jgi:tRNA A-37 threonylcarbamoyl transferase component Bud32